MEIEDHQRNGVEIVSPSGRVDTNTSGALEKRLLEVLQGGSTRLVVDMTGVEYISSAGLRVLLLALRKMQQTGGQLALCGLREGVRQIFEMAGFLTIFQVEPSVEDAVARLGG